MKYLQLLPIFFVCSISICWAQENEIETTKTESPYQSLYTLLYHLNDQDFNPGLAASTIGDKNLNGKEREAVAIKLKQVLDGSGTYIYIDEVPKDKNYYDSARHAYQYILDAKFPNIYLEKRDGKWQFFSRAIKGIDIAHGDVFKFGTDKLLTLLPKAGTKKLLGLSLWQHLGIFILAFMSFLTHKIFTLIFEKLILRILKASGYESIATKYILPVARPLSIFLVVLMLVVFVPVLQLSPAISRYVILTLKAFLPLFGTVVIYRLVGVIAVYLEKMAGKTESTLDDQMVPLIRKTLKSFVVIVGGLFILENLNIPILPLLTGLSIGGLAFALAAQDTIKNFFGSLMIFIDKPFQIGDWITSGDIDGTVEEVGFRSTRIRTFRDSVVYVPNGHLADSTIDNHGLRQYRRFYTQIAMTYDTPAELIELFVEGLKKIVGTHPDTRKDYHNIYFNEMADSSLNVMLYIFFDVPSWGKELKARHEVLIEVVKLAEELGVNFAFPTQTLHIENLPGQTSLSPQYDNKEVLKNKLNAYFEGQKK
jgi:MscS family membrane protein